MHLAGHCYEIKKQLRINRASTKLALEDVSEKIAYFCYGFKLSEIKEKIYFMLSIFCQRFLHACYNKTSKWFMAAQSVLYNGCRRKRNALKLSPKYVDHKIYS